VSSDIPWREIVEFMAYTKTVLGTLESRLTEIAQATERLRDRVEMIEREQVIHDQDQARIIALEGKNPCEQCMFRKNFETFYANEWPAVRNKVLVWNGIIGAAVVAANILIKVL